MSFQVSTAFVAQFSANVMHLAQQMGSRLAGTTLEDNIVGEKGFWEQVGLANLVKKTVRHSDTPHTEIPHARRMVVTEDYIGNEYIDQEDKVKLLIEPTNEYAQAFGSAVGRLRDDVIIAAATATAYTGKDGTTATSFLAANQVAVNYVETGVAADSNLTVGKVRKANQILNGWDIEENDRFAVIGSSQLASLQRDDEFTSRDYNVLMPLMSGQVPEVGWMGFMWRRSERLAIDANNVRTCLFYQKRGIKVGIGRGPVFRISERPDKNYAIQVHVSVSWGGTRMEEKRVVSVACDEDII